MIKKIKFLFKIGWTPIEEKEYPYYGGVTVVTKWQNDETKEIKITNKKFVYC